MIDESGNADHSATHVDTQDNSCTHNWVKSEWVCTSYPPTYKWTCSICGEVMYKNYDYIYKNYDYVLKELN